MSIHTTSKNANTNANETATNNNKSYYEKYIGPMKTNMENVATHVPILHTATLVGTLCVLYDVNIIVQMFKLLILLNIILSGVTVSSLIVGTCIYKKHNPQEDEIDEDESEVEVEEEPYEDKYNIDEIDDISGNTSESVYISDVTPNGIAFMKYNKYKEGFEYWADKTIQYEYLDTMCRKYVKYCRCKNMYIDRKRLLKEKQERLEEEKKQEMEQKEMEKEDKNVLNNKVTEDDDDDDVFAKLKTNVDKQYENRSSKKKSSNVVDKANKYIYMGKLNEMVPFNVTRNDELSDTVTKKNVSFSMFKALGLK